VGRESNVAIFRPRAKEGIVDNVAIEKDSLASRVMVFDDIPYLNKWGATAI
jgi:hypothetical protein